MNWRFPFRREVKADPKPVEKKSFALGLSEELGSFLLLSADSVSPVSPSTALRLYERSTAVSVPINMVAEAFSIIPVSMYIDGKLVPRHEVLEKVRNPSPWHTEALFLDILAKNYLITHESPLIARGNINRPPLELIPISPSSITPDPGFMGDSNVPRAWHVTDDTNPGIFEAKIIRGQVRYFQGNLLELFVARGYSTRSNSLLRGQSPLLAASREVRSHILGTEHNVQLLERGGRVSLVFHFEEDMDDDDFEATRERVIKQYGGASKAGTIGVTAGGKMNVNELGVSPKDMDYIGLYNAAQKAIALTYKVPLPLITDERQTLNNYKEGKLALYDDAVIPLARRLLGSIGYFLLPRYGLDPGRARFGINPDDVTALVSRRTDELLKRVKIGAETPNEIRGLMGREPVAGGDTVYQPASVIPIGSDLFTDDDNPDALDPDISDAPAKVNPDEGDAPELPDGSKE